MLSKRTFLFSLAAGMAMPRMAAAYRVEAYTPALWEEVKTRPQAVILNFRARWSLTCQIKQELLVAAMVENPAYADLSFIDVDWDTYGPSRLTEQLKVDRRSTLLVMKQGREVARLVNAPEARKVRALLDQALAA